MVQNDSHFNDLALRYQASPAICAPVHTFRVVTGGILAMTKQERDYRRRLRDAWKYQCLLAAGTIHPPLDVIRKRAARRGYRLAYSSWQGAWYFYTGGIRIFAGETTYEMSKFLAEKRPLEKEEARQLRNMRPPIPSSSRSLAVIEAVA
jgi:hypothetical protein